VLVPIVIIVPAAKPLGVIDVLATVVRAVIGEYGIVTVPAVVRVPGMERVAAAGTVTVVVTPVVVAAARMDEQVQCQA
jgi:hypothetical protein